VPNPVFCAIMSQHSSIFRSSRRGFLGAGLGFAASITLTARALAATRPRVLTFENLHTGEKLTTTYWAEGEYLADSANQIARILRDHRTNASRAIDPSLLDLLHSLREKVETHRPYEVISCYRSPQTNASLANATGGVATRSLHMSGQAIDVRVAGVALANLRDAARSLGRGGVGFYPRSDFVHVDTGRIRTW